MRETPDHSMARVQAAWSISMRLMQTATVALGGVLATIVGVRTSIGVAASICLVSCAFLPWRHSDDRPPGAPPCALP